MVPKLVYNMLKMVNLCRGLQLKFCSIKVGTCSIFEGFFSEIAHQRAACMKGWLVDNIVEGTSCKVTEQYSLTVCPLVHAADEVG